MKALKDVCKISKGGKSITSNIKGAVFVTRSTGFTEVEIFTGKEGIKKYHGCVVFVGIRNYFGTKISQVECKKKYLDKCPGSSAWLVIPVAGGYDWYYVGNEIKFTN